MTHRVPFRQTWPPLQDPRLNLGCCRYSIDWQCHCAGILPTDSATVPVFYWLTVPLCRYSTDWQCHCVGILPTYSANVPAFYRLTVPLCRYSTDWHCQCAGILPTDSATVPVFYRLTVPMCRYCTDWECHCAGIVPTDSATVSVLYRLTVPLCRYSTDWQCHCAGILPTDSATVSVLYRLTVPLRAGHPSGLGSILHSVRIFYTFFSSRRPILGPPSILMDIEKWSLPLTTHLQLMRSLIMRGAKPPLPHKPSCHFNFFLSLIQEALR